MKSEIEKLIKHLRKDFAKFLKIKDPERKSFVAHYLYLHFNDIFNFLQYKADFNREQVSEGPPSNDPLFQNLAEGYWKIGVHFWITGLWSLPSDYHRT